MTSIQVGDPAPDFTAQTQDSQQITLSDFRGQQAVVLFFYPMDGTPFCTAEACAFRDAYDAFTQLGAAVIGVSGDSVAKHHQFAANHRLPFRLVSDPSGEIRNAFGVPKSLGIFPGRVTYLIDKKGIVRMLFNSQLDPSRHVAEALQALKQAADEPA